ncbi:MAG: NADH-quinone oxidoreductase subunit C [Bacteriovoracaceae bacterium]|nr:NADH-quinone oxidoreductase subunit C [Bacteriovoracaceae bacterium]
MHNELTSFLQNKFPNAKIELQKKEVGDEFIILGESKNIVEVCETLKNSPDYLFNVLQVISGVDYPTENMIEVNYILASFSKNLELILKVRLPRENPTIQTVSSVWKSADFQERECYDMLGVIFEGHPDFRRILCPDDWEGYPLRKDYVPAKMYKHMEIYPEDKMNLADQEFVKKQKAENAVNAAANRTPGEGA